MVSICQHPEHEAVARSRRCGCSAATHWEYLARRPGHPRWVFPAARSSMGMGICVGKPCQRHCCDGVLHLAQGSSADVSFAEQRGSKTYQVLLWDTEGLPATTHAWSGSLVRKKPSPKTLIVAPLPTRRYDPVTPRDADVPEQMLTDADHLGGFE